MTKSIATRPAGREDTPALEALFEMLDEHHRLALPHIFRKLPAERREPAWLDARIAGPDSANKRIGFTPTVERFAMTAEQPLRDLPAPAARGREGGLFRSLRKYRVDTA